MTRAYYDKKPPKLEAVGNGNYLYRWDILEEEVPAMEMDGEAGEPRKQWSCREVTIHGTPEYGKCVEAVIRDSRSNEEELSLINQYNAYQQGLSGDDSVVSEYKEHLSFVDGVKKMVREDLGMEVETTKVPVTPCLSDLITLCTALARSTDNGLTETQKAKAYRFFPTWDELLKKGEPLPVGTELQDGGEFFRVVQAHTPQADWKPAEQHALYAYVSPHEGTEDDPIPYRHWMLLEAGKYYTEYGVMYKCTQSLGVGYDSDLSGLAAFVTVV